MNKQMIALGVTISVVFALGISSEGGILDALVDGFVEGLNGGKTSKTTEEKTTVDSSAMSVDEKLAAKGAGKITNDGTLPLIYDGSEIFNSCIQGRFRTYEGFKKECIDNWKGPYDINLKDGWTPLSLAASEGQTQMVEALLTRRINVNMVNRRKMTALDEATLADREDIVRLLVERCNATVGASPYIALHQFNKKLLQYFLSLRWENGAGAWVVPINTYTIEGKNPLVYEAIAEGNIQMCEFLCEQGADFSYRASGLITPLEWARRLGKSGVANWVERVIANGNKVPTNVASESASLKETSVPSGLFGVRIGAKWDEVDIVHELETNADLRNNIVRLGYFGGMAGLDTYKKFTPTKQYRVLNDYSVSLCPISRTVQVIRGRGNFKEHRKNDRDESTFCKEGRLLRDMLLQKYNKLTLKKDSLNGFYDQHSLYCTLVYGDMTISIEESDTEVNIGGDYECRLTVEVKKQSEENKSANEFSTVQNKAKLLSQAAARNAEKKRLEANKSDADAL